MIPDVTLNRNETSGMNGNRQAAEFHLRDATAERLYEEDGR